MTEGIASIEGLRACVDSLFPEHAQTRRAPTLEPDAHPAVRALWTEVGESAVLAPQGLVRTAFEPRAEAVFAQWLERPAVRAAWSVEASDRSIPRDQLPAATRWLSVQDDALYLIDDASPEADPPILVLYAHQPGPAPLERGAAEFMVDRILARVPVEQRGTMFYGTPIDAMRVSTLGALHPRLHTLAPGVWTWQAPPERVREALGATVFFDRLGAFVDVVLGVAVEHRPWLMPPKLPALGLERSGSPAALPVLDPTCSTPAANPAGVELTPAFQRVTRGQQLLPQFNRVGRLQGLPVWIFADPESDEFRVFHETADRMAVKAQIEALGGVVAWLEGRDLREDPEPPA